MQKKDYLKLANKIAKMQMKIARLQRQVEIEELLETIYSEIGPYNERKMSERTMDRLRSIMNFNDDE